MIKTKFQSVSKFEYHYQEKSLFIKKPGSPPRSITKTFTTNWEAPGFILDPDNHWMKLEQETQNKPFKRHLISKEDLEYTAQKMFTYATVGLAAITVYASVTYLVILQLKK